MKNCRWRKRFMEIGTALGTWALLSVPVFADFEDATSAQTKMSQFLAGIKEFYTLALGIALPVMAVALAACAIWAFTGGQRAVEQAISVVKKMILGYVLLYFAPTFVAGIISVCSTYGWKPQ